MENKTCFVCDEHTNPFKTHWEYDAPKDNPENFVTVSWFGTTNTDPAHSECWQNEK